MADPVVLLTVSVNGGPPQQGGITCALGATIQLSATNKVGWGNQNGLAATRWEIRIVHTGFSTPSGWTSNGDGSYYVLGNDDPPTFSVTPWGKYAVRVIVGGTIVDETTMISVESSGGIVSVGWREGLHFGGIVRGWLYSLDKALRALDAGASFNPQATPQNITTTGGPSVTSVGTRTGEEVNLGPASGAGTYVRGIALLDGAGNDVQCNASSWIFAATAAFEAHGPDGAYLDSASGEVSICAGASAATGIGAGVCRIVAIDALELIGDTVSVAGQSGVQVVSASSAPINETGKVKLKADTAIEFTTAAYTATCSGAASFSSTSYALTTTGGATLNVEPIRLCYRVRVISTANIASLTSVTTIDGVTLANNDLVLLKDQSTPTENGLYRFTLSTTTLARATAFDSLAEYHLGTQARAYAGSTNKGKAYQLTALSSSLPATWEDITGSGGGGGASISDSGASVDTTGGSVVAESTDGAQIILSDKIALCQTDVAIYIGENGSGGAIADAVTERATTSIIHRVGSSDQTHTVSGASRSVVTEDAAGSTACTDLYDNAACSRTVVGTYAVTCATSLTETVGSASRTVTASSTARTETYNGTLTHSVAGVSKTVSASGVVRIESATSGPLYTYAANAVGGQVGEARTRLYAAADGTHFDLDYNGTVGLGYKVNPAGECDLGIASGASYRIVHNGTLRIKVDSTGIGFFGVAPVGKPAALTAANASTINSGDGTTDAIIGNMRTRINELETKLQALGLLS